MYRGLFPKDQLYLTIHRQEGLTVPGRRVLVNNHGTPNKYMRKPYIPILAFALLLLLCMPLPLEMATSVVPGWHTTVFAPQVIPTIIISLILLIVLFTYWRLSRKASRISILVFAAHFLLTLPLVFYSKLFVFLLPIGIDASDTTVLAERLRLLSYAGLIAGLLFIAGQVLFAIYAYKILKKS